MPTFLETVVERTQAGLAARMREVTGVAPDMETVGGAP